jgi:membrane protease YdiL (CAAX protease family)
MVGIIIQLLISFIIIYWLKRENLSILGLKPTLPRIKYFTLFLFIAGFCSSITFLLRMFFAKESWHINPSLNWELVGNGVLYNFKSVLYEELIFRGVLFYLLIKRFGGKVAILISATAFGIYHWFSYEIFDNPINMAWIFIMTGTAGVVYGIGYLKTGSLLVPIGMHFGWNFVNAFVFSNGNTGPGILVQVLPVPQVQVSYFVYFLVTFLHFILFATIPILLLRNKADAIEKDK